MCKRCRTIGYRLLMLLVIVGGLTGCAAKVGQSGFLVDYSDMKPDPKDSGAMIYANPKYKLTDYNLFIIDPFVIHFAPNTKGTAVEPSKLTEITQYARQSLIRELEAAGYKVVSSPGPGTLRMRAAFTEIKKGNVVMSAVPQTKLAGVGLGGAACEAIFIDTPSGDTVFKFMQSRLGSRANIEVSDMDDVKNVCDYWTKNLIKRLRGKM